MAGGPGKLRETTKPDDDHVWNGSEAIGSLVVYLVAPDKWLARKPWFKERTSMGDDEG